MEYIIVKDNRTDLQLKESIDNFDNIENIKIFTRQGVNFYANKDNKKFYNFQIMNEKYLGPIIEKIFKSIYLDYLKKFPYWNNEPGKQSDYINIELKDKTDINNIIYYWHFQGVIFVQDTRYDNSIDGISFKAEFNGTPKFQIVAFDLIRLKQFKKNENKIRQFIDIIDDKIVEQNLKNFELDLDI